MFIIIPNLTLLSIDERSEDEAFCSGHGCRLEGPPAQHPDKSGRVAQELKAKVEFLLEEARGARAIGDSDMMYVISAQLMQLEAKREIKMLWRKA
ncbi:hypothetical protein JCM11641_002867 [Rhodosporidiobolus odoratus]